MEQWNSESLRESSTATVHPPHLLPDFHGSSELMEHLPSETRYGGRQETSVFSNLESDVKQLCEDFNRQSHVLEDIHRLISAAYLKYNKLSASGNMASDDQSASSVGHGQSRAV
ncbi:hypothetical protein AMTR_s00041p00193180 [Amborella trichopoda]|uniref:Uncharacterized protein n=1 Tax=Amborella trichopoda TaxID=13333 RepID=W1Q0G2_AMBTC|nr:hypothetical protein AMTR_s00041p00193180 [Amborella trichopoda]